MKLSNHEKELLSKALEIVTDEYCNNDDCYFDEREGEEEYLKKVDSDDLSEEEYNSITEEFENKPTHFEELVSLIDKLTE